MSENTTRPVSPGTTDPPYSSSYHPPPQHQQSFPDLQNVGNKAHFGTSDQPTTSTTFDPTHPAGAARLNPSLDLSLASSIATTLSSALGSASSSWSTHSPSYHQAVHPGYSHPASLVGTPESRSRVGSAGPHSASLYPNNMESSAYESSWRNHYGQSGAANGYNLGGDANRQSGAANGYNLGSDRDS